MTPEATVERTTIVETSERTSAVTSSETDLSESGQAETSESNDEQYSTLYERLRDGEVRRIKLIGDSITAGNASTGFTVPEDGNIIFEHGEELFREATHESKAWANYFRNYINASFSDVEFINAGIGGKSAVWANENKEFWLSNDEDVVFVMLGTNDRWASSTVDDYVSSLEAVLLYIEEHSNLMIVMSPPPTLNDDNGDYNFGIKEIDQAVKALTKKHDFQFISNYDAIMDYVEQNDVELTALLETTGSHPIDAGYQVIWENLKAELTLLD